MCHTRNKRYVSDTTVNFLLFSEMKDTGQDFFSTKLPQCGDL